MVHGEPEGVAEMITFVFIFSFWFQNHVFFWCMVRLKGVVSGPRRWSLLRV